MKRAVSILLSLCFVLSLAAIVPMDDVAIKASAAKTVTGGTINTATFIIDPGHGGAQPGAMLGSRKESDDVLRLSLRVAQIIIDSGETCALTRWDDTTQELVDKTSIANAGDFDYFVSIHRNASGAGAVGIESYYYSELSSTSSSAKLTKSIHDSMVASGVWTKNRGVKTANFYVLKNTDMPATLLEVGFIDVASDNVIFDTRFEDIALSIASGMLSFIGKSVSTTKYQSCMENPNGTSVTDKASTASLTVNKTSGANSFDISGWTVHTEGISTIRYKVDSGSWTNLSTTTRTDIKNTATGYSDYSNSGYTGSVDYSGLSVGNHTVTIQAVTKKSNTYTVGTIALTVNDPKQDFVLEDDSTFKLEGEFVTINSVGTSAAAIEAEFKCDVVVYDLQGKQLADGAVGGTGCVVKYLSSTGEVFATATVVLTGDLDGDGAFATGDYMIAKLAVSGDTSLEGAMDKASDLNGDEIYTTADLAMIRGNIVS